jgi:5-deoxy-glucuronate isomerase
MVALLRATPDRTAPIVAPGDPVVGLIAFDLARLKAGESREIHMAAHETVHVVQEGSLDVHVDELVFSRVGRRADIWSGPADSVYAPPGARVRLVAAHGPAVVAIAGGMTETRLSPFRVTPEEVEMVEVGSVATHSRRRIFHILGQNGAGRAGNLLVSELYADPGCWSGYPPHKHDEDRAGAETNHEELYHYRFRPETGFGAQVTYRPDGGATTFMTRDGDTYLLDKGYHPTVTSPGHEGYIFTILVGATQRGLVQHFDERHAHLLGQIPGLQAMRDKFK